jgi:hypothetical protein
MRAHFSPSGKPGACHWHLGFLLLGVLLAAGCVPAKHGAPSPEQAVLSAAYYLMAGKIDEATKFISPRESGPAGRVAFIEELADIHEDWRKEAWMSVEVLETTPRNGWLEVRVGIERKRHRRVERTWRVKHAAKDRYAVMVSSLR